MTLYALSQVGVDPPRRLYNVSRGVYNQDYDDDGESAAGGRLLHLLQVSERYSLHQSVWGGGGGGGGGDSLHQSVEGGGDE